MAAVLAFTAVLAFPAVHGEAAFKLGGRIQWQDDDALWHTRPEQVQLTLFEDERPTAYTRASAEDDWQFAFELSAPTETVPRYRVEATVPRGYHEVTAAHIDPTVGFTYPSAEEWDKYEPCNQLDIPREVIGQTILAGKMTKKRPFVIWTTEPLSAIEQTLVWHSVKQNPGVGNPSQVIYLSGTGSSAYGMTVDLEKGKVLFNDPSDWSLLFGGTFEKNEAMQSAGSLTFAIETGSISVKKQVSGSGAETERTFAFTATLDSPLDVAVGPLTFVKGEAFFFLHHDEMLTLPLLPAGVTLTVAEQAQSDYVTRVNGLARSVVDLTVRANETVSALFVNEKNATPTPTATPAFTASATLEPVSNPTTRPEPTVIPTTSPTATPAPTATAEPVPTPTNRPTPPDTSDEMLYLVPLTAMLLSCGGFVCLTGAYRKK